MGTPSVNNGTLIIEGQIITGEMTIAIHQSIYDHHTFAVEFDHAAVTTFSSLELGPGKGFIGKSIIIKIDRVPGDGPPMKGLIFKGIITQASLDHPLGYLGHYHLNGHGSSIMTDGTPSHASWQAMGLAIVKLAA